MSFFLSFAFHIVRSSLVFFCFRPTLPFFLIQLSSRVLSQNELLCALSLSLSHFHRYLLILFLRFHLILCSSSFCSSSFARCWSTLFWHTHHTDGSKSERLFPLRTGLSLPCYCIYYSRGHESIPRSRVPHTLTVIFYLYGTRLKHRQTAAIATIPNLCWAKFFFCGDLTPSLRISRCCGYSGTSHSITRTIICGTSEIFDRAEFITRSTSYYDVRTYVKKSLMVFRVFSLLYEIKLDS